MPAKLKGMTSLEIAIIVAIVLVIAVAVGWYLYTTFAAAGQQSGLIVTKATIYSSGSSGPTLYLEVVPQGAAQVEVKNVEIAGISLSCSNVVVSGPTKATVTLTGYTVSAGQVLTGRIVLASGAITPFTATVVAGNAPSGSDIKTWGCSGTSST